MNKQGFKISCVGRTNEASRPYGWNAGAKIDRPSKTGLRSPSTRIFQWPFWCHSTGDGEYDPKQVKSYLVNQIPQW